MKKMEKNTGRGNTWTKRFIFVFSLVTVLVAALALGLVGTVFGSPKFLNSTVVGSLRFNPYYGTAYTCKLCHGTDSASPSSPRNSFGIAWANSSVGNHQIPMTAALVAADTDGDTFSNSAELFAGTYPGVVHLLNFPECSVL
jgi:hypothetical protein